MHYAEPASMWCAIVATVVLLIVPRALAAEPAARWQTLPPPPAMPGPTSTGTITVGDGSVYYATYGADRGARGDNTQPPVILLHGGLGNSDHWALQLPELSRRWQVVVVDSRNQGRSALSHAPLSYRAMADDVIRVMHRLAIPRASLVGWSDGGEIALALAIHHPDRVARVFVVGAYYDARGAKPHAEPEPSTLRGYYAKCRADFARLSPNPKRYRDVVASLEPVWRAPRYFTVDELRAIRVPTLLALGDHDELVQLDQVRDMARLIPGAQLHVFADASHFVMWQDPDGFSAALIEFLAR